MFELIKSIENKYWVEIDVKNKIYWIIARDGILVKDFVLLKEAYKDYEIRVN